MPSAVTTHQSEDADAGGPLRRIFLLADLASEIHNHNKTKGRIVDFRHKIESLRSTVWQAEQTVTLLCQQLTSLDEQGVGKIRIEYDVSAFDPFYGSATENNIGRGASHVSPVRQQGQKRNMIHEEELEENGEWKKEKKSDKFRALLHGSRRR